MIWVERIYGAGKLAIFRDLIVAPISFHFAVDPRKELMQIQFRRDHFCSAQQILDGHITIECGFL